MPQTTMSPSDNRDSSVQQRTSDGNMKVAKPDYYHSHRSKLDDWLNKVMLYSRLEGLQAEGRKTMIAASYFRGQAQQRTTTLGC